MIIWGTIGTKGHNSDKQMLRMNERKKRKGRKSILTYKRRPVVVLRRIKSPNCPRQTKKSTDKIDVKLYLTLSGNS